jgi:2-dehydropantoate 2-reductase
LNIVVLGAGAVGGYFGGKLAHQGYPVTFLVREKRFEQLKKRGLRVDSVNGSFEFTPTLARKVEEVESPDVLIVALKNYHMENALPQIEQFVAKGAKVLPLLNGIEHLDLLISKCGKENVLGGLCYIESTLNEEGDVVQTSPMQDLVFGPLVESQANLAKELKEMMEKAQIKVTLSDLIMEEMWKKYIFLTSLSGITSAMRKPIGVPVQDPVTSLFLKDLIKEVYDIARARDIALAEETVENVFSKMSGLSPNMTSSMHRDLEKGLPLELDSLHGYLINVGAEKNIETPCLRAVYALLHPYKNGK